MTEILVPSTRSTPTTGQSDRTGLSRRTWTTVCRFDDLLPERGVAALVDGVQVAVFRLHRGQLHAVAQRDPFSGANIISRGIIGTRGEHDTVASPMHKQVFDLATGTCLDAADDADARLTVHDVRLRDGLVEVALAPSSTGPGSPAAGPPSSEVPRG